jgi:hypothetical protein
MLAKRRFRPSRATVVAPSRRPSPPGTPTPDPARDKDRRGEAMPASRGLRALGLQRALRARPRAVAAATALAATLALGGGAAVSLAATTGVYFDSQRNVGAGPSPFNNTAPSGFDNVALGHSMMPALTSGSNNAASGNFALLSNTTGTNNVASGTNALLNNTTGTNNVASGTGALTSNTTADNNLASGTNALFSNTTGGFNLASGTSALFSNTTGSGNLASGNEALFSNTTGNGNIASGRSLFRNTTGSNNVASGTNALFKNTIGNFNLASGITALSENTTGSNNVASGSFALSNKTTGSSNLALGFGAGTNLTSGSNNVYIANRGVGAETGKIHIGTKGTHNGAFMAGISGASIPGPTQAVRVNANGRLGTATASSERLKRDVRPLGGAATRRVLALRPVSYRYKRRYAAAKDGLQYGLVAEQVARQLPALVQRGPNGEPAGVYYEQLSTLLLAELKRQDRELRRLRALVLRRR